MKGKLMAEIREMERQINEKKEQIREINIAEYTQKTMISIGDDAYRVSDGKKARLTSFGFRWGSVDPRPVFTLYKADGKLGAKTDDYGKFTKTPPVKDEKLTRH